MYKVAIEDDRLTSDMNRTRSGKTQLFRKDYGDKKFTDKQNADVVLTPPSDEMYAELIDGVWYRVKGCSKCEDSINYGQNYSYQVCYEHNRCVDCGTHRDDLTEAPWGISNGFRCKTCQDKLDQDVREKAFASMPSDEDYDEYDFKSIDEIKCPHCCSIKCSDDIYENEDMVCDVCEGKFSLEVEHTISYSTTVIGERLKA